MTTINNFNIESISSPLINELINSVENDNILVIIQLNGGNDGLNTVIPLDQYSGYINARPNVGIPENKIISLQSNLGLHPAMSGFQSLFNEGKINIVQSVGYPNPNFSHFRATDIWMSAADSDQILNTGWGGRYLTNKFSSYPIGYPNDNMPDPLAIQIGSLSTLLTQGPYVNTAINITNTNGFYNLLSGTTEPAPNNLAGKELTYIRTVVQQSNQYNSSIKNAANKVTQQLTYPDNPLAAQLKIVARLVAGGLKTKLYVVQLNGFDTHANQVVAGDSTIGNHANLLKILSDAVKAFMDDCAFLGIEDKVAGMTYSEFGRRIKSNSSTGTDHGTAAPMFVFGGKVNGGITGTNPIISSNIGVNDNIDMQFDYRTIYSSLLSQWLGVDNTSIQQNILLNSFGSLPLINQPSNIIKINRTVEYNVDNNVIKTTNTNDTVVF